MRQEVWLMGRLIRILFVDALTLDNVAKDKETQAYFDNCANVVYLLDSLSIEKQQEFLCHELMHATLEFSGLKNIFSDKKQEALCDAMEAWSSFVNFS